MKPFEDISKEKPLPLLLDEFRTALRDEIEVAKRNTSNSAIPLSNGHKVAQLGSAFQYAFLIDSVLNTPDGAPVDLMVPGKSPLEATIVSAEGLRLVISVNNDLGQFVPTARLQTNLTILMRKLIERIENNSSNSNEAASRMLGETHVTGAPIRPEKLPNLNENQLKAFESALGRNLTIIWGPPGTGKTHTIGTIAEHLYRSDRTVLIVSHTNIAVDQAVKHVASAIPDKLPEGDLIRIGEVRDEVLKSEFPDVLLKKQVERQSQELSEQRDKFSSRKQTLSDDLNSLEHEIAITEWVEASESDIQSAQETLEEIHNKEEELGSSEKALAEIASKYAQLLELQKRATTVLSLRKNLALRRDEENQLCLLQQKNASDSEAAATKVEDYEMRLQIAQRIEPLRQERASYPSIDEQKSIIGDFSEKMTTITMQIQGGQRKCNDATAILQQSLDTGVMMRLWKRLPKPEDQQEIVNNYRKELAALEAERTGIQKSYDVAEMKLSRIIELNGELSQYADIDDYSEELTKHKRALQVLDYLREESRELASKLEAARQEVNRLRSSIDAESSSLGGTPEAILNTVDVQLRRFLELQEQIKSLRSQAMAARADLTATLSHMLHCLLEWGIVAQVPTGIEDMLALVIESHTRVAADHKSSNLPNIKEKATSVRSEIAAVSSEIARIDDILAQVEKTVIANASIIGATLTKTYLSDDIQARKFDTVILDEASMAPIPALWAAALLSEKNLIIVGDFKQLPPIVLSTKPLAIKWLGRDVFEASGVKALWMKGEPPKYFIPLNEQRRMLPQIAEIANRFYDGILRTPAALSSFNFEEFFSWYNRDWPHDNPVVLVDTGSLNAWVTSVVKNGNSSRLNFLSATVAVDLAEQLLLPERAKRPEGAPKRILIVAPYRAHAKLVSILLRENTALRDDVIAGTAHSFQGSEADVVIFDLVADEPHFRVNLFIPALDDQLKCLLNVSLTRAKYRLIILGDFAYCQSHGKKAFLGKTLLPFLTKTYPRIDASQLVPEGLASRAARAQMTMLGGEIEPDSDRIVVTQADFFRILSTDLSRAEGRIVIYSPFMTQDRTAFLLPQLQAASSRGVSIFIITKSHSERSRSELQQCRKMEAQLGEIGVVVMHKMRMHEKLVFIDDDVTWSGSLNPLSFSNTQEIMERRKSASVLQDYFKILRLDELLSVYGNPESKCPICGSEMVAAEGADEPYYWRCINDGCYSRSINQPYPYDGVLTCGSCNSPVEFGYWGDYPHWRCTENARHRQKVFKSHLHLPKMAALVPKSERRKLCRLFGIANFDSIVISTEPYGSSSGVQTSLFDDDG